MKVVRYALILVGALMIGCAGGRAEQPVTTTPAARLAWLETELARAEPFVDVVRGTYLSRGAAPGAAIVCSLAIQIDAWYGVSDERWELTHAESTMMPAPGSRNIREELARIGIRDCVLDTNR